VRARGRVGSESVVQKGTKGIETDVLGDLRGHLSGRVYKETTISSAGASHPIIAAS
jgi:hypothetical protein